MVSALIEKVFFAQTHVHTPEDPYLNLIGKRNILLKAQVTWPSTWAAPPYVTALVRSPTEEILLNLSGPAEPPPRFNPDPTRMSLHSFDDSFTAVIPGAAVVPGMTVNVSAGESFSYLDGLRVGAPVFARMIRWDVQFFGRPRGVGFSADFEQMMYSMLPVTSLMVQAVPVTFPQMVVAGLRATSVEDFQRQSNQQGGNLWFDGEQGVALNWVNALTEAGGLADSAFTHVTIIGVAAGGQAGSFRSVSKDGPGMGTFIHELGHSVGGLPHWGEGPSCESADPPSPGAGTCSYPYRGAMFGFEAPEKTGLTHRGPVWAYSELDRRFQHPFNSVGTRHADGRRRCVLRILRL